jgi:hypothetical protein
MTAEEEVSELATRVWPHKLIATSPAWVRKGNARPRHRLIDCCAAAQVFPIFEQDLDYPQFLCRQTAFGHLISLADSQKPRM